MKISIRPLPAGFLRRVRETGLDDQDQPVRRLIATGGEPCRDVLRRARPGEAIILASYCPFASPSPFREYGAVYVLANPSAEPVPSDGFPAASDYFEASLVLRAYDQIHDISAAVLTSRWSAPKKIEDFLSRPDVRFVDARFPTFGCFACRFERVTAKPALPPEHVGKD
ncbi:hypothetical protein AYO41_01970 [Verrucomicrobia bacterium SCGC AG-212-E04]|nr:hypothetical protein AYO41_01970 [Verrucomicrobia bacterium SCGC AG-212-E04]